MSTYKHEMDKIRLSEQGKKRMLALYSSETKKEERNMKKLIKPVVAAAACAAILLGYTVSGNMAVKENSSQQNAQDDHSFTMMVNAEELKEDRPVLTYSGDELESGWAMCGEEDNTVSYSLATDFACEGENIKTITYRINNGAFQIIKPEGVKLEDNGISMNETEELGNVMMLPVGNFPKGVFGDESLSDEKQEESENVDGYGAVEYTLDYENQKPENIVFNICGKKKMGDAYNKIFGEYRTVEEEKAGRDELLGDIVITCTATFTDGTTASREIVMENKIMTPKEVESEAVIRDKKNHPEIEKEIEVMANEKRVYLFFKMK